MPADTSAQAAAPSSPAPHEGNMSVAELTAKFAAERRARQPNAQPPAPPATDPKANDAQRRPKPAQAEAVPESEAVAETPLPDTGAESPDDLSNPPTNNEESPQATDEEPPEETEPEAEADSEKEKEGEDENETEPDEPDPKTRKDYLKRIDKLTAKRKEAERAVEATKAEAEALKAKVAELEQLAATTPASSAIDPLGHIGTEAELAKTEKEARLIHSSMETTWKFAGNRLSLDPEDPESLQQKVVLMDPYGKPQRDKEGNKIEISAGEVLAAQQRAAELLNGGLQQRRDYLKQEKEFNARTEQDFTWLKEKKGEEYQIFQQVARAMPHIKQRPDWQFQTAIYVRGIQAYKADLAAKTKPAATAKPGTKPEPNRTPPKTVVAPKGAPTERSPAAARGDSLKKLEEGKGSQAALADYFKATAR